MSIYSIVTKGETGGAITFEFFARENENPVISCEVPIEHFIKNFPKEWASTEWARKDCAKVEIYEGLYDDELDHAIQVAIKEKEKL